MMIKSEYYEHNGVVGRIEILDEQRFRTLFGESRPYPEQTNWTSGYRVFATKADAEKVVMAMLEVSELAPYRT